MELGKALIIGVGANDFQDPPSSKHIFAEVILINNEADGLHPLLYQLKSKTVDAETLFNSPAQHLYLPHDAFVMIGSVTLIDKKKKQIVIKDKSDLRHEKTVSYKHLIIASKMRSGEEQDEFAIAIHALVEAQKIRKNTSETLQSDISNPSSAKLLAKLLNRAKKQGNLSSEGLFHLQQSQDDQGNPAIINPDKRLYEVQL